MIPLLLLLVVGVGQDPGAMQKVCPKGQISTLDGCKTNVKYFGCGVNGTCGTTEQTAQPAPLKYGKYEHWEDRRVERGKDPMVIIHDAGCWPDMHPLKESEYQEIMERLKWIDHIRAEQCPSLSWINGKCLPYCDEIPGSTGSCAHRNKPSPER